MKTPRDFHKYIHQQKESYKKFSPIFCKILNTTVYFNSRGFNHLRFNTNNSPRNRKEVLYKLNLLPYVRQVIQKAMHAHHLQRRSPIGGRKKSPIKEIAYYALEHPCVVHNKKCVVKVIIRKIGDGKVHFWSVMHYKAPKNPKK